MARLATMPAKMIAAPIASPRRLTSCTRWSPGEPPEHRRHRQRYGIGPCDVEAVRAHRRRDQPIDVDGVHGEQSRGQRADEERRALHAAKEEEAERREEV